MRAKCVLLFLLFPALAVSQSQRGIVVAKSLGPAPGAIVCHDLGTVSEMFDWYAESWEERMDSIFTGGKSAELNGGPLRPPDLAHYGCALAKPGTRMRLESAGDAAAHVSFRTPKGHLFRGVTQTNMYDPAPPQRR